MSRFADRFRLWFGGSKLTQRSRGVLGTPRNRFRVEPLEDRRMLSVLFVDADAAAGGDGTAWESAYTDIQSALDTAAAFNADTVAENNVDAIWIAEGTYLPSVELEPGVARSVSFSLVDGVTLYGGFEGTEATLEGRNPDPALHETVLSGDIGVAGDTADNASTVVYCGEDVVAALDGVTVTLGNADYFDIGSQSEDKCGGGVFNAGALTVRDSVIRDNAATRGGGAHNTGTLLIENSTLTGNATYPGSRGGGAIMNWFGTLGVVDSTLSGNSGRAGGAIWNDGDADCTNVLFQENTAFGNEGYGSGGGFYNDGTATLTQCTFVGNEAVSPGGHSGGGAICNAIGEIHVVNSTIAGNRGYRGGGIYNRSSLPTQFDNSVIAGNDGIIPRYADVVNEGSPLTGAHNLIGNGMSWMKDGEDGNLIGTERHPIDPRFVRNPSDGGDGWGDDPTTPDIDESANDDFGDLRLLPDSPAVNAGDNALLPADTFDLDADGDVDEMLPIDLDGNSRIQNGIVDMGAYELFVEPAFPADLNGDGFVGSADLDIIRANWGRTVLPWSLLDGDATGDGLVNAEDLDVVRANWETTAPAAAVDAVFAEGTRDGGIPLEAPVYGPRRETLGEAGHRDNSGVGRERLLAAVYDAWLRERDPFAARR